MKADKDVVIVGAGFAGLYAVHKLRNELGLEVQAFDAGGGPGGTWWWNRYPGARCDFDSVYYSYSFSEEIQREWQWTEKYAAQPEILNYLEWVADRLDLKRSFQFNTRVTSMVWNDEGQYWTVGTDDGRTCTARYVVCGTGNVSIPKKPEFPGIEDFKGEVLQTSSWPHEPVDFSGKRVGIIGTGATGIQLIPELAKHAAHLTVFQRTAQFASPLGNEKLDPEARRWLAENHKQVRAGARDHFLGAPYDAPRPSALADSPEERKKVYDEHYGSGGFRMVVSTYGDLLYNRESNDTIADYLRDRIRERVTDPKIAEMLCPTDHPYATKRAPFETNYYETYNRDNVTLVDVRSTPIERVTEHALKTTAAEYEIDVLVMATGFDVFTRPLLEMGIVGRDGLTLDEKWSGVPGTYLGIQTAGFPNLFTVTGPQSAVALYNNALAIEDHVEWISRAIGHLRTTGATTIEPTAEAESRWGDFAEGILNQTLIPQSESSWYMGANVVGKTRGTYIFAAGAPVYRAICAQVAERGYAGFAIDGVETAVPPMAKLDPEVVTALSAIPPPRIQAARRLHRRGDAGDGGAARRDAGARPGHAGRRHRRSCCAPVCSENTDGGHASRHRISARWRLGRRLARRRRQSVPPDRPGHRRHRRLGRLPVGAGASFTRRARRRIRGGSVGAGEYRRLRWRRGQDRDHGGERRRQPCGIDGAACP